MRRTRIKICGLKHPEHVDAAVEAGADALGFVFFAPSPRAVTIEQAATLAARVPAFVSTVALFVEAEVEFVQRVLQAVRVDALQFHGSRRVEHERYCAQFGRPYIKAAAVDAAFDLLEFVRGYPSAAALLLDSPSSGHGGSGRSFDWRRVSSEPPREQLSSEANRGAGVPAPRIVLSGGLTAHNVAEAIAMVRPYAVDVSSGVEVRRGEKSTALIYAFCQAVRDADARLG
ncbi:MAG: phosphoribosylanthranilate isomerase [Casimicrobiaceae bacterium]|nr:phosphoribosylanthranilate isomerase [Casimicrobiaceae bacterium]